MVKLTTDVGNMRNITSLARELLWAHPSFLMTRLWQRHHKAFKNNIVLRTYT